jgi:DNA-binding transcriptional regulator LsrR (DeoR family)
MYITGALIPPNQIEIAAALKLKHWEVKRAIEFWLWQGIVKQIEGEFYPISQLN